VKYRGTTLIAVTCGLLFLSAAMLGAQVKNDRTKPYKTCVFPTVDLSTTEDNPEYQQIISDQLHEELKIAGFDIIPREKWDAIRKQQGIRPAQLYRADSALKVAEPAGAELAIVSFYSIEDRQLVLEIKCYDAVQGALVAGVFKTARVNLSVYNVIAGAVSELIPEIRLIGPPPRIESPVVERIALVSEDEDMAIYLGEEGYIGRISGGKLLLPPIPFALGSEITVEKRKEDYHPGVETLKLKEPEMLIKLKPLRKKAHTATELNWSIGQLLGFGLAQRFYLKPDSSYLAAEHYFYVQHNFSDSKPVFHHDLRILFGGYLFSGPHATLRLNVSTGFGMIVTYFWLKGQPVYGDYYWDVVNSSFEVNFRRFILYIRSEQKYALGIGSDHIFERGWISAFGEGPSTITFGVARKW